jgi:hypothetical protein
MRRIVGAIIAVVAGLAACGGGGGGGSLDDPAEACQRVADGLCGRFYDCLSAEEREAAGLPGTEEECADDVAADIDCAGQTVENTCNDGEVYDPGQAADCIDAIDELDCAQLQNFEDNLPECDTVCTEQ